MKRLLATTAIASLVALPLAAQEATQTQTPTQQTQSQAGQTGQMEIQASNLIGKRLWMMGSDRQSAAGMEGDAGTQPAQQEQMAEGAEQPAGQDQQMAEGAQQPAGQDQQMAEGAQQPAGQDQQMVEGAEQPAGQDQQMAGDAAPSGMQDLSQGITDAPDNWEMAGEIDDVLLSQEGEVQALVIDAGGILGMDGSLRRVGLEDVTFVPDTDDEGEFFAVYTGDRARFEQSEAFDETALAEGTVRGSEMWGDQLDRSQSDVAFTSLTSDDLVGTAVYGSEDNWVGEISELALSESGEVEAIIVDVGGFLGIGEKPVALGMEQIQIRRGEGGVFGDDLRAYVNATEEELESMDTWAQDG